MIKKLLATELARWTDRAPVEVPDWEIKDLIHVMRDFQDEIHNLIELDVFIYDYVQADYMTCYKCGAKYHPDKDVYIQHEHICDDCYNEPESDLDWRE